MVDKPRRKISRRDFLRIGALTTAGLLAGVPRIESSVQTADTVFMNGKVITVDNTDSVAHAVAVRNGTIMEVGTKEAVSRHIGRTTKVIDLAGRTITPGFIDSHAHLPFFGQRENGWMLKLHGVPSKEEIIERLAERARQTPKGGWIYAWGVEDISPRFLDKGDLDRVTTEHPMLVIHTSGQWGFANSRALAVAKIKSNTANPPGSQIAKDAATEEPTGLLVHYPALQLVRDHMPKPDYSQAKDAILYAAKLYAAEGVTTVHDNFFTLGDSCFHKPYLDLIRTGEMPVRIKLWPYISHERAARWLYNGLFGTGMPDVGELQYYQRTYPDVFRSCWGGFKLAVDGTGPTALFYLSQRQGLPLHKTDDLNRMVQLFHRGGHQISFHAMGDKAADTALDAIEAALKDTSRTGHRHRIEHVVSVAPRSYERMQKLGVVISTHPQWLYPYEDRWSVLSVFEAKGHKVIPLRSYLKQGIPVAIGADPPAFSLYQPQIALWQAAVRHTRSGKPYDPGESISIREIMRCQTMGSAYAAFQEKEIGSIEKGKKADLVVWDRDFYTIPVDQVRDAKAELTMVNGSIVYERHRAGR